MNVKSFLTLALCSALALSSANALKSELVAYDIEPSKHNAIPDTSSKIVTSPQKMDTNLSALELTRLMGNGINLGNTLEAWRGANKGTKDSPESYETLWGQPVTTQALMKSYKKAGFDSVRIPVAWMNATDFEHGDYVVNTAYIDRVETVVNYALKAGLYVIVNDHWDGSWWGMFGSANPELRESARELYKALWTQIAVRFRNYSEKLIFEGGNEEHGPGFNDARTCTDSGTLTDEELYEVTNELNQTFVDLVRSTGGNNANRFLLLPGYNTNIAQTCDERYKIPTDSAKNKLLVSVHYYDPSPFCMGAADLWGTRKDYEASAESFKKLTKFTEKGIGVIIGEYAALPLKDGENGGKRTSSIEWLSNVLDNCDYYNYCPLLWDCSDFYIRRSNGFKDKDFKNLYTTRALKKEGKDYKAVSKKAKESLEAHLAAAPERFEENALAELASSGNTAVAWIMYASKTWGVTYSIGDKYDPDSKAKGLKTIDTEITGEGSYKVALDFSGTGEASGFAFCALGIMNGEKLFPNYIVDIKSIKVNGQDVPLIKKPYTTSDDGNCTRVNIFNEWVTSVPAGVRTVDGSKEGVGANIVDRNDKVFVDMKSLVIEFDFIAQAQPDSQEAQAEPAL